MNELEQFKELFQEICINKHELYFKYNIYFIQNFSITIEDSWYIPGDKCLICKQINPCLKIVGDLIKREWSIDYKSLYTKRTGLINEPPIKYFAHISICENEKCKKYQNCCKHGPYFFICANNARFFDRSVSLHELTMFYKPSLYYSTIRNIIDKGKLNYKFNDKLFIDLKKILPKDIFDDIIHYLERLYVHFPHFPTITQ
jgi:hypothetical protein